jgi:hypothetical protein
MNENNFYAIRVTLTPDLKVESKVAFPTQPEAQKHIDSIGKGGEHWILVEKTGDNYKIIRGYTYQKNM